MAFSTETFTGVAAQTTYTFTTLQYLSSDHLLITVDGASATFTVSADQTQFTLTNVTPSGGETILVTRITPNTVAGRLVDFQDGAGLRADDLDTATLQLLYVIQEAIDDLDEVMRLSSGGSGDWDAESIPVGSIADGVAATDLATKGQLDALSAAVGNLPAVTAGNNNYGLFVVSGLWQARTPAQSRTHLGLGTAAVEDAGTAAGELVQYDGSAYYPANDGRNIDLDNHSLASEIENRATTTVVVLDTGQFSPALSTASQALWSESAAVRVDPGTVVASADNSAPAITLDSANDELDLAIGTYEITADITVRNTDTTGTAEFGFRITDDDDTASQVVHHTDLDEVDIPAQGSDSIPYVYTAQCLVKGTSAFSICLRARENAGSSNLQVDNIRVTIRRISTSGT